MSKYEQRFLAKTLHAVGRSDQVDFIRHRQGAGHQSLVTNLVALNCHGMDLFIWVLGKNHLGKHIGSL